MKTAADERGGAQLVGAFQSNASEPIRSQAEGIVSVVQELMAKRSESQKRMLVAWPTAWKGISAAAGSRARTPPR